MEHYHNSTFFFSLTLDPSPKEREWMNCDSGQLEHLAP